MWADWIEHIDAGIVNNKLNTYVWKHALLSKATVITYS